jgi:spermidine synthase
MTPWRLIDQSDAADPTRLELFQRGTEFSIRANGALLMNSRVHGSEEAQAKVALEALPDELLPRARVLVGGLGCGYTLGATLARLGAGASVTVAELSPAVVRWNREFFGDVARTQLEDARVEVLELDVVALFRARKRTFDAILLDVDNGPRAVAPASNAWLYAPPGLTAMRAALGPGGVLAIWSAGPELGFSERLRAAGFNVECHRTPARTGGTRRRHWIWVARRIEPVSG